MVWQSVRGECIHIGNSMTSKAANSTRQTKLEQALFARMHMEENHIMKNRANKFFVNMLPPQVLPYSKNTQTYLPMLPHMRNPRAIEV